MITSIIGGNILFTNDLSFYYLMIVILLKSRCRIQALLDVSTLFLWVADKNRGIERTVCLRLVHSNRIFQDMLIVVRSGPRVPS